MEMSVYIDTIFRFTDKIDRLTTDKIAAVSTPKNKIQIKLNIFFLCFFALNSLCNLVLTSNVSRRQMYKHTDLYRIHVK